MPSPFSCQFAEEMLWFGYWDTGPCCVPLTTGTPPRYQAAGNLSGISPRQAASLILEARESFLAAFANGQPSKCLGCRFLRHQSQHASNSKPYLTGVILSHIEPCNFRCVYCYQAGRQYHPVPQRLPSYDPIPIIEELTNDGCFHIERHAFWGGGEPTLAPELPIQMQTLSRLGFHQTLNSNCSIFSQKLADLLTYDPKITLVCSIDAGGDENYAQIKGKNCAPKVWENLQRYLRASSNVVLKYIVLKENLSEIESFVDKVVAIGISGVLVDLDCGLNNSREAPSYAEIEACRMLVTLLAEVGIQAGWGGNAFNLLKNSRDLDWLCSLELRHPTVYFPFRQFAAREWQHSTSYY